MRTAFVFAGGGSLGAIQVGSLRELVRAGERPDIVVGASVGALNASYFAARPTEDGIAELEAIWLGLRRRDIFPITLSGALGWLRGAGSVLETAALRRMIRERLPLKNLEQAEIPVHVVATSLSGAPVQLCRGPVEDAVLASTAIPIAFPSVLVGDEYLMDGAIAGNTPILTAAELGATRIIVLQTGYACSMSGPPKSAVARGMHALTLLIANQMERDLRLLDSKINVHIAPHLCPLDVSPFDFTRASELIERSAQVTRQWLENGGLRRSDTAAVLRHDHAGMAAAMASFGGFDLVSYSPEGAAPKLGLPEFAATHDGRTYHFANPENRAAFVAEPGRFLPQYDGHCAFAMASNKLAPGNPEIYRFVDGKLYFNFNAQIHAQWDRNRTTQIAKADVNWLRRMSR